MGLRGRIIALICVTLFLNMPLYSSVPYGEGLVEYADRAYSTSWYNATTHIPECVLSGNSCFEGFADGMAVFVIFSASFWIPSIIIIFIIRGEIKYRICKICNKKMKGSSSIISHMKRDHPLCCPICITQFNDSISRTCHDLIQHSGTKNQLNCPICGHLSWSGGGGLASAHLYNHIVTRHPKIFG